MANVADQPELPVPELGIDLFLERLEQLANRFDGVPQHLRVLMLCTLLATLWLWVLLFISASMWMQLVSALFFLSVFIPLFFVYQLYELSQTVLSLPAQALAMRDRLAEHASVQAFALAEIKNRTGLLNAFSVLRELRAFVKASGGVTGLSLLLKLRFVKAVNPFFSFATFISLAICWFILITGACSLIFYFANRA